MRCIVALLAIFFARAALAEDDMSARLFGSWRLISFQLKVVGEEAEPKDIFGPNPIGRIIFSPEHRVVVFISRAGRRPPTSESEAAALLSSMTAYTGKSRLDGDKFITQVDGPWNEFYKGSEQVRYFELTGDKLSIRTPEQDRPSAIGSRGERNEAPQLLDEGLSRAFLLAAFPAAIAQTPKCSSRSVPHIDSWPKSQFPIFIIRRIP